MKNTIVLLLTIIVAAQHVQGDIILSSSATDPLAGSSFEFEQGTTNDIFVWVSTMPGQTINGLSLSIVASMPNVIAATNHIIENPNIAGQINRWTGTNSGVSKTS